MVSAERIRQQKNNKKKNSKNAIRLWHSTTVREHCCIFNLTILMNCYTNSIIMQSYQRVPASENEIHSLVVNNFRKIDNGSSTTHNYELCTHSLIQDKKLFRPSTFPQSSGKSKRTKGSREQWEKSNCGYVIFAKYRRKQHRREGVRGPQTSQYEQIDCPRSR